MNKAMVLSCIGVGSFSIWGGGGKPNAANFNTFGGGGGYCQKYIYACVQMNMYAHTCVKYSYTHACIYSHVCMHAQPMQTYILHPDMKSLKSKQAISMKNSNKYIQVNEEIFGYLYCLKAI